MATFYEQRMLNLPERYGISDNATKLLKAYEDFKTSQMDEEALGRLIRLSPNNRAALVSTMVNCANIMKGKPEESKHCFAIISSCGEMVQVADKPPISEGFPSFQKLPCEIRNQVHKFYLGYPQPDFDILCPKRGRCLCAGHEPLQYASFPKKDISLAFTCKQLSKEVLFCFFETQTFHFSCACEMGHILMANKLLTMRIRSIKFHWCGSGADNGIWELKDLKCLKRLVVIISRNTTKHLTLREEEIRTYFTPKRAPVGLHEALGFDELMELRGVPEVSVEHINKRKADRRTDDDVSSLQAILRIKTRRAREDDDDDEDEDEGTSGNYLL